jgi:hypothetical protein
LPPHVDGHFHRQVADVKEMTGAGFGGEVNLDGLNRALLLDPSWALHEAGQGRVPERTAVGRSWDARP